MSIKTSKANKNFKLVSLTENRIINKNIMGIRPNLNTENAFKKANVMLVLTAAFWYCFLEKLYRSISYYSALKSLTVS